MDYSMFDEIDYFTNFKGNSNMNNNTMNMNNGPLSLDNYNESANSNKLSLYTPYEGYTRGNMFKNLYNQYKNYIPYKIKVNSEQEEAMLNLGQMSFAAHDLSLYLDNFPNDKEALELFNKYRKMTNEARENYERRYGPINVSSNDMMKTPYAWENDTWPWEM